MAPRHREFAAVNKSSLAKSLIYIGWTEYIIGIIRVSGDIMYSVLAGIGQTPPAPGSRRGVLV